MYYKICKNPPHYDHDRVKFVDDRGKTLHGHGFIGRDNEQICLLTCPSCEREQPAFTVTIGDCCWCGFNPNNEAKHVNAA